MLSRRLLVNFTGQYSGNRVYCLSKLLQQPRHFSSSPFTFLDRRKAEIPGRDLVQKKIKLVLPRGNREDDLAVYNLNHRLFDGKLNAMLLKAVVTSDNHIFLPLGTKLIDLHIIEAFQKRYPYLPGPVLADLSNYYQLPRVLGLLADNLGVSYARNILDKQNQTTPTTALKSIVGLVSKNASSEEFNDFMAGIFDSHIRKLNIKSFISNPHASEVLNIMLANPEYRILNESGRKSDQSIFRVGVFVNGEFLAEGTDRKISRAKFLAADKALLDCYLSPATDKEPELVKHVRHIAKMKSLRKQQVQL